MLVTVSPGEAIHEFSVRWHHYRDAAWHRLFAKSVTVDVIDTGECSLQKPEVPTTSSPA
jgi:hypothetical protein